MGDPVLAAEEGEFAESAPNENGGRWILHLPRVRDIFAIERMVV